MSQTPDSPGPWGQPNQWSDPPPGGAVAPPEPPPPPPTIVTAVRLMYVGAILSVLGVVIGLTQRDELREQIAEDQPELSASELDVATNVGMTIMAILGIVGVGLWIWMAVMNRKGRSWARIVATVLGSLNIAFTGLGLLAGQAMGQSETTLGLALSVASLGLAVVILLLLFQAASSQYYEAVSRYERGVGWG